METRTLGRTDLVVTRLGFGGARIGLEDVNPDRVGRVLNRLLDDGITLIDTAACYHDSEELIGRYIGGRRNEYVLATKCGHVTGDATGEPWTRAVIEESIDRSLQRPEDGPRRPGPTPHLFGGRAPGGRSRRRRDAGEESGKDAVRGLQRRRR